MGAKYGPIKKTILQLKCNQTFKQKMEGEQIPKATMTNFLKSKMTANFSAQFTQKFLQFAKNYIDKLTQQANDVCAKNDKKTINSQHIESALINLGLPEQLVEMKEINNMIKEQNQQKQEFRQRIQQNIEKNLEDIENQGLEPRVVEIKNQIGQIAIDGSQKNDDDEDYEMDDDSQQKEDAFRQKISQRADLANQSECFGEKGQNN